MPRGTAGPTCDPGRLAWGASRRRGEGVAKAWRRRGEGVAKAKAKAGGWQKQKQTNNNTNQQTRSPRNSSSRLRATPGEVR